MANRPRPRMAAADRAKQFLPFAALKGLPEALAKKERVAVPKIVLSEDMAEELDRKIQEIVPGRIISKKSFVLISSACSGVSTFGFLLNI